ncbi:L-rhamnono-gamma-lactonase [Coniothyrium glycines]
MPPPKILDTHIHLWPATATSPSNHAWMTPGHFLARQHSAADYTAATHASAHAFVYVETDRYLPSAAPPVDPSASAAQLRSALGAWAREPLGELAFLRGLVEGEGGGDAGRARGVVMYAPVHLRGGLLRAYLTLAEEVAGAELWARVVGVRYLLQGKRGHEVARMVGGEAWVANVMALREMRGGEGWAFDVGVDVHRDGEGVLDAIEGFVREVRRREQGDGKGSVRFVLNHLCKPPFSAPPSPQYLSALTSLSHDPNVFMKLSGAFNEFSTSPSPSTTPSTVPSFLASARPFFDHVFSCFPDRVMFGSDWPVCNVGGPKGEKENWGFWVEVVEGYLEEKGASEEEKDGVWWRTGARAYGVDV